MSAAVQTVWAELVAGTLADAGVDTVVVSPGSRSTPLVCALAACRRLALPTIIDERAAGFFALGLARATGRPVALVCTSGTAAAHYLPAIIEASLASIPLVVLTADRPPELHGCGAAQTIDQVKLYGGFARAYVDLGAPEGGRLALRAVRRKMAQAVATAIGPAPGPVHVEVPLRKPLEPRAPSTAVERESAAIAHALLAEPLVVAPAPRLLADDGVIALAASRIAARPRGVIVAGPVAPANADAVRAAIHALAVRTGYPLLAEAGSQARLGPRPEGIAIDHAELLIAAGAGDALAPELIIQVGAEPAGLAWPAAREAWRDAERWVIAGADWIDPDSSAAGLVRGELVDALTRLAVAIGAVAGDAAWTSAWRRAEALASAAVEAQLSGSATAAAETALVRSVVGALPAGAALVIGNSLPIRVVDEVCAGGGAALTVVTQRGANGIDGLIAGAAGTAFAGVPTVLVLGDVSFAHDLGALATTRLARAPLAIVVVDNGGGRIFDGLPVAGEALPPGALERHWRTPPAVDPVVAAAAFGLAAQTVRSPDEAASALRTALAGDGPVILHAPVVADGHAAFRRDVIAQLSNHLRRDLGDVMPGPTAARIAEGARR